MRISLIILVALLMISNRAYAQAPTSSNETFKCLMKPNRVVKVGASAEGVLEEVHFGHNDLVKAGQVLARLRSGVEEASLRLARLRASSNIRIQSGEAQSDYKRRELQRSRELFDRKVLSSTTLEKAETEAKLAELAEKDAKLAKKISELELERAAEILAQRTIKSPINGVVVERTMEVGEYVHEQASLMVIAELDPLRVEVFVPIALYGSIKVGMRGEIRPEAPISGVYEASVAVVDRVFDAASNTFGVRLELPNTDYELPAGHRCKVRFLLED